MTNKQLYKDLAGKQNIVLGGLVLICGISGLLLYRLATLTPGLSVSELHAAREAVGWHGIFHDPLYLPLKLVRSVIFVTFPDHGQLLSRLPNALFGCLSIGAFGAVVRYWHGNRTALLSTALFACSAWVLHVSRLASFDVLYLWALPTLILTHIVLAKHSQRSAIWYGSLLIWGLVLFIPGMVWPLLLVLWLRRQSILDNWRQYKLWWQRLISVVIAALWLPLLAIDLLRPGQLLQWLGLPGHVSGIQVIGKQLVAVPVHLFVRGPQYPELWLSRAPVLDIFALAICLLGIYFYARHQRASRSRLLGSLFIIGALLVGLGGPVKFSLLVPLLYFLMAAGLAYLSHEWLQVFPRNPLARGLGIGLIVAAVSLSCLYNLRAYFVAWPHTESTRATFHYHP